VPQGAGSFRFPLRTGLASRPAPSQSMVEVCHE
jgi:hypothetical protein